MEECIIDVILGSIGQETDEIIAHRAKEYLRLSKVRNAPQLLGPLSLMLPHACIQIAGGTLGTNCERDLVEKYDLKVGKFRNCVRNISSILNIEGRKSSLLALCISLGVVELYDDLKAALDEFRRKYESQHPEAGSWESSTWDEIEIVSAVVYMTLKARKVNVSKQAVCQSVVNKGQFEKWVSVVSELYSSDTPSDIPLKVRPITQKQVNSGDVVGQKPPLPDIPVDNSPRSCEIGSTAPPEAYHLGEFTGSAIMEYDKWKKDILHLINSHSSPPNPSSK